MKPENQDFDCKEFTFTRFAVFQLWWIAISPKALRIAHSVAYTKRHYGGIIL